MKKTAVVFLLSFLALSSLNAQIKFIPKIGSSFSTVFFSDDLKPYQGDTKSKLGLVLGVGFDIPIVAEKLSFQPELLYHQKGYRYTFDTNSTSLKRNYRINYLELPVLAKIKFGKFYGIVGPSFSMGIGGRARSILKTAGTTTKTTFRIKFNDEPTTSGNDDAIYYDNRFDVGIQAGAGMNVSVLTIELRYAIGLISLRDYENDYMKNSSFLLTIGFPIDLKK